MGELVGRTVLIYLVVLVVIRCMGKREIGQFSPFDFVVAIIIAELAAIPMENKHIPLWQGITPILTLGILEIMLSYLALKSVFVRRLLDGCPQVVIANGEILKQELRRARYNLDDLLAQLRERGIVNPAEVEFAVLETSGRLSVIPRSQKRPVTPADLNLPTTYEGLPLVLIMDGVVLRKNLLQAGLDEEWLDGQLGERGVRREEVFLALLLTDGSIYLSMGGKQQNVCRHEEGKAGRI